tara:strand:+ start:739 stop:3654 length:2916 start_codon:yes stop_codon:yes gene_type:complete
MTYTEKDFENHFEEKLKEINYRSIKNEYYNKDFCLISNETLEFIKKTQSDSYEELYSQYSEQTDKKILQRISDEIENRGLIDVLRKGIKDRGVKIFLIYFEPVSGLNPESKKLFNDNIFTIIRQVKYSKQNEKSIDMVLFINGIPIITIELKNSLTGQRAIHAIKQYINDRDPKEKLFKFKRCLVHFAIGNEEVFMTTRINGTKTSFLPFNKDIINPVNLNDHKVSYMWEWLFRKSILLDLIQNYVHIQEEEDFDTKKKREFLIFPRYHQLVVINKLKKDVIEAGIGKKYLIQHTTGSGKSLTIGWLSHQIINLFKDNKSTSRIFDTVIILTDRKALDEQLRNTVMQLEQTRGVVNPVTEDSQQLKEFIESGKSIIISTIQKFPFISGQISKNKKNTYGVIIDEVHSSQSGRLSAHIIKSLSDKDLDEYHEGEDEEDLTNIDELILNEIEKNRDTAHISYFGFSGTPKKKTLELFGKKNDLGEFEAFHYYTMEQSIAEKFTLDVLQNYTTYSRYFKINEEIDKNKSFPKSKVKSLVVKAIDLHPHTIKQKTEIILDHFLRQTSNKIQGRAKGMVVTRSRIHCVKYKLEFDKKIKELGLPFKCLVAFSGKITEKGSNIEYTEASLNNFSDKNTAKEFKQNNNKILIVNNKFQTGFNEPMLHTMYVDKKMLGLQCVQTLSRINRTMPGKIDTSVIDFVNKPESVKESFQPYYKNLILGEETDPNQLYKIEEEIKNFDLFSIENINDFLKIFYNEHEKQEKLQGILDTVSDKFRNLENSKQKEFRGYIILFVRIYGFLSQIITFKDIELEKLYIFLTYLIKKLPYTESEKININSYVDLEFFKIQKKFEGNLTLDKSNTTIDPMKAGKIQVTEEEHDTIENIIKEINERFASDFTDDDKNNFEKMKNKIWNNKEWNEVKKSEATETNKRLIFKKIFEEALLSIVDENLSFYEKISSDNRKNFIQDKLYKEANNS